MDMSKQNRRSRGDEVDHDRIMPIRRDERKDAPTPIRTNARPGEALAVNLDTRPWIDVERGSHVDIVAAACSVGVPVSIRPVSTDEMDATRPLDTWGVYVHRCAYVLERFSSRQEAESWARLRTMPFAGAQIRDAA